MRRFECLFALLAVAILGACATNGSVAKGMEADSHASEFSLPAGLGVFVEWPHPGTGDGIVGAFLPSEWWEPTSEEVVAPGQVILARRPVRRGSGPGNRRQPPLLNPRPTPDQPRFWAQRPPDPRVVRQAQQLYRQRLAEAQARYPNSTGYQDHHCIPIYLGGQGGSGPIYRVPTAYHKAITQAFRQRWPYGQRRPDPQKLGEILLEVYAEYPIPQLIGIQP